MPAPLALILCTLFVIYLFRYDSGKISRTMWIPTLWMLTIASKGGLSVWVGGGGETAEAGSPVDRIFFSGLLLIGLLILQKRRFNWSAAIRENQWLFLLICYMLVSLAWSDFPFISFKRWIRELTAV